MRTHQLENIWISWGLWRGSAGGGVTVIDCWGEPMGAKLTICCCRHCLRHNREEKNAILRWDHHHHTDRMTTELIYWNPSQLDACQNHNILLFKQDIPSYSFPSSSAREAPQLRDNLRRYLVIPATVTQRGRVFLGPSVRAAGRARGRPAADPVNLPSGKDWTRSCRRLSAWETRLTRLQRWDCVLLLMSEAINVCTRSQNQQHITALQLLSACHLTYLRSFKCVGHNLVSCISVWDFHSHN